MGIEVTGIFGLILLVLNVWAIINVVQSGVSNGAKVLWIVFIFILPLIGFLVWLVLGPRGRAARA